MKSRDDEGGIMLIHISYKWEPSMFNILNCLCYINILLFVQQPAAPSAHLRTRFPDLLTLMTFAFKHERHIQDDIYFIMSLMESEEAPPRILKTQYLKT